MREPRPVTRLRSLVGRRGALLIVLSFIDIVYGLAMITSETVRGYSGPRWWPVSVHTIFGISVTVWGYVWIVVGLFLLTGIPKQLPDWPQFGAAIALWVWWSFVAAVFYFTTSSPGAWGPEVLYAGCALLVLIAAGWEDPP